jgi:hypothetical protein
LDADVRCPSCPYVIQLSRAGCTLYFDGPVLSEQAAMITRMDADEAARMARDVEGRRRTSSAGSEERLAAQQQKGWLRLTLWP